MRRRDREIRDRTLIDAIIEKARVCRLGLADGGIPYIVPMNFGYTGGVLYFHSAPRGRKIDIIRRNSAVCFEIDIDHELVGAGDPCRCTMRYRSVIGFGRASIIDDPDEKRAALEAIAARYSDIRFDPAEERLSGVAVIRVEIDEVTGKVNR